MKKKTAILLVGAFVFTAAFSGCGKNKEATEAANESVESEDPEGKAKNSNDAEEEEKEEAKENGNAWVLTFALLVQSVILVVPMMIGIHIKI